MLALLLREYNSYDPFVSYCRSIRHLIEATTSVHDKRRVIGRNRTPLEPYPDFGNSRNGLLAARTGHS